MADINLTCPNCKQAIIISEYVSDTTINCHACGTTVPIPGKTQAKPLRLRTVEPKSPSEKPPRAELPDSHLTKTSQSQAVKHDRQRATRQKWLRYLAWLSFLALAAVLYYLRFKNHSIEFLPSDKVKLYGLCALGLVYIAIILHALADNIFSGLLALFIPFYPFYYIFFNSGSIFLRGSSAVLLAIFGRDLADSLQAWCTLLIEKVQYLIQNA